MTPMNPAAAAAYPQAPPPPMMTPGSMAANPYQPAPPMGYPSTSKLYPKCVRGLMNYFLTLFSARHDERTSFSTNVSTRNDATATRIYVWLPIALELL